MAKERKGYPSDVSDEEWAFCAPYLTLMKEDAPQREHSLRDLYNGLRWFVRAGCPWRMMPNDLPPWHAVQQQTQRWLRAGCFETMAEDLRALLRLAAQRESVPTAMILDSRTRCNRRRRVVGAPVTMGLKNGRAARSTRLWTHLGICWRLKSPRPMNRIEPRWENWPERCSRRPERSRLTPTPFRREPSSRKASQDFGCKELTSALAQRRGASPPGSHNGFLHIIKINLGPYARAEMSLASPAPSIRGMYTFTIGPKTRLF